MEAPDVQPLVNNDDLSTEDPIEPRLCIGRIPNTVATRIFALVLVLESIIYAWLTAHCTPSSATITACLFLTCLFNFSAAIAPAKCNPPPEIRDDRDNADEYAGRNAAALSLLIFSEIPLLILTIFAIFGCFALSSPFPEAVRASLKHDGLAADDRVVRYWTIGFAVFFTINNVLKWFMLRIFYVEFKR
ncbi:hypothetical protein PMAYCL1PPCAC_04749, partial [Pristionchus mayeri]